MKYLILSLLSILLPIVFIVGIKSDGESVYQAFMEAPIVVLMLLFCIWSAVYFLKKFIKRQQKS